MTVENLLDCFKFYPDQITYFDTTNNIQDQIDLFSPPLNKFCGFIEEYGEYEVIDWSVHKFKEIIEIYIKMEENV